MFRVSGTFMRSVLFAALLLAGLMTGASPAAAATDVYLCKSNDYSCLGGTGYTGQTQWGSWGPGHNCVSYAAYRLSRNGVAQQPWGPRIGNANEWDEKARAAGFRVDVAPAVGSIAQWDTGSSGHVAYVEVVTTDYIEVSEDSYLSDTSGYASKRRLYRSNATYLAAEFIHVKDVAPANPLDQYVGNVVKWRNADGSNTSWLVYADRTRRWVPTTAVYSCLVNHGAVDKGAQTSTVLNQLPDRAGSQATCSPPARPTTRGVVSSGQGLDRGVTSSSGTGFYSLVQQGDGNLVLYKSGGRPIWSNSANGPTAWTIMQGDGNLVSYDVIGRPRWASNTGGNGASRLVVQDDGNAVVYRNSDGRAVWQSGTGGGRQPVAQPAGRTDRLGVNQGIWRGGAVLTSSDGRFQLILQGSDGNLVIYKQGVAIWAIGGRDDDFLVNQGDGNVVIYRTHGGAVWSTGTGGQGGSTLVMQSDGNLVLYRGSDGRPIWSSGTAGR